MILGNNNLLQNRYLILRLLGQGGFGAVYEAKDQRLGHRVALKQLILSGQAVQKAFEREARILARLKHAALPKVSDYFTDANGYFLVMEFIPGDDLEAMLAQRHEPFPVEVVLGWAFQVLEALEYLHGQQPPVVHRDIKPANIKISPAGKLYLLDFGISKGGRTHTHQAMSGASIQAFSEHYASIEQIEGHGTDARSDLYSLAVTLHHLLTMHTPPRTVSRARAKLMNKADPLRPVNELNAFVPLGVGQVLTSALNFDPALRPDSAHTMRHHFPSIDHAILLDMLRQTFDDRQLIALAALILEGGKEVHTLTYDMVYFTGDDLFAIMRPRRLPIGNMTSQFWANVYLNGLDHDIKGGSTMNQLLKLLGLGAIALVVARYARKREVTQAELFSQLDLSCKPGTGRILVIGSGFSGLAVGRTLHDLGYEVTILEARDRIGGRVLSRDDLGFALDMGASWIHGVDGNPISELANQFGVELSRATNYESASIYDTDGSSIGLLTFARTLSRQSHNSKNLASAIAGMKSDRSLYDALNDLGALDDLPANRRRLLNWFYYAEFHQNLSSKPTELSTRSYLQPKDWDGEEHFVLGGIAQIANALAEGLTIKLNQVVEAIDYRDSASVRVSTNQESFEADRCIVTVPLGVLKQDCIQFRPPLPAPIQNAVQKLAFGRFFKLAMKFPRVFWDQKSHFVGHIGTEVDNYGDGEHLVFVNLHAILGEPALLMFAGTDYAEKLEKMAKEDALAEAMARLKLIYGEDIPEPEQIMVSDWIQSPYTGGSYTYYGLDSTPADMQAFEELLNGQLTFAGEHTSAHYPGSIHGAYISGLMAAKRICDSF